MYSLASEICNTSQTCNSKFEILMFFLKKCLGYLMAPGTVILALLSYGLLRLIVSGKSKQPGWVWIFLATGCFYLFSSGPLPNLLLYPLESQCQPFQQLQNSQEIQYIAVLAGGERKTLNVPPTSQLDETTALRVVEGIRLYNVLQARPVLVMSGGGRFLVGEKMSAFAHSLGIPQEKLIAEAESLDTYGNARGVKAIVKEATFLLVTSASHMPRSLKIFQLLGMQPIPAPADFRYRQKLTKRAFLPLGENLTNLEAAVHEYLGLTYLKLFPGRAGK
jgi:uncharacterized SAM-binding protein YcdF (DUF218 family)